MKIELVKDPAIYPEIQLGNLKRYAVRWADNLNNKYEHIQVNAIFLCRLNTEFEEHMQSRTHKRWVTKKYGVVVEIIGCDGADVKSVEFYPHENADEEDETLRPEKNYSDCQNFIAEIKFVGHYSDKHPFIDDAFERSVYRKRPSDGVIQEWKFLPKVKKAAWKYIYIDEKRPLIHLDTVYALYRADQLPDAVLRTIEKAKPEIELLYEGLKKEIEGSLSKCDSKVMRKAALAAFERCNKPFKLIKKSYLLQEELYYKWRWTRKRAFVGKLLQLVVEGQHSKTFPAYELREAYGQTPTGTKG